ncbi:hypothetical protein JZX76_18350 [Haloarcula hispanica]|uniref:Uncharacterized protein n=1 Tax=Haloarcula hispanica TaxID=51589 RepID=A0A482T180_HALHI|nr:hypothetical protein [Haloarcula hispanica]MCJ0621387.1 hypothetical protein [Haloarcula hispanica]RYJ07702.1 hypothetical protein ELS20_18260 [Haloarcula hispanica]
MDIHVTLRHGPLEVDIDAGSDDDYQSELLDLLEFLEEYEERFSDLEPEPDESETNESGESEEGQASMDAFTGGEVLSEQDQVSNEGDSSVAGGDEAAIESLAKKAEASPEQLREFIDIDPDREEPPFIVPETGEFADTKTRRQFIGSLILLAVWDDCYEEDRMKSSTLKDGLEFSGINSDSMYNMYDLDDAERLFDKTGRGGKATVKLTRPGKREAYKTLRELLNSEI